MKKLFVTILVVAMLLPLFGCAGTSTTATNSTTAAPGGSSANTSATATPTTAAKAPGSVTLSIMIAVGTWTDKFNAMIDAYKAINPQIKTIANEFPSSSTYWDLLKSKLASNQMPDIYGCGFGEQIGNWKDYLADLSNIPSASKLSAVQVAACSMDGKTIQVFPINIEGWGILYNMRLLNQVGWQKPPTTISDMKKLCEALSTAGIKPFIHHYAEASLTLTNHLGTQWITVKKDPLAFFKELKTGKDMDLKNDADLNAQLDYYDLVLQYGNDNAIAMDKTTGRNSFFLEEAAMIDDEGSWEIPNIAKVNPPMTKYVVQGVVPITNDASRNRLQTASICAGIFAKSKELDEAKAFLNWLVSSDTATLWHQDVMGNIPSLSYIPVSKNLATLGQDVYKLMQDKMTYEVLTPWTPDGVKDALGEVWSLYVGKKIDRATFFTKYQAIWTTYAAK